MIKRYFRFRAKGWSPVKAWQLANRPNTRLLTLQQYLRYL